MAALAIITQCPAVGADGGGDQFVRRDGAQLHVGGQPFYFIGANAYQLVEAEAFPDAKVEELFSLAASLGMTVIRTWAFNYELPAGPGNYSEPQFRRLDLVVSAAAKHGLRLVLALGNLWPAYRGPEDFLRWATGSIDGKDIIDFYHDSPTKEM